MMIVTWSSASWKAPRTRNRLWVYPIISGERSEIGTPIKIIDEAIAEFVLAGSDRSTLYLRTDLDAEAGRLVASLGSSRSRGAEAPEQF